MDTLPTPGSRKRGTGARIAAAVATVYMLFVVAAAIAVTIHDTDGSWRSRIHYGEMPAAALVVVALAMSTVVGAGIKRR